MKKQGVWLFLVSLVAALGAMAVSAAGASASSVVTPVQSGCPAGFTVFVVPTPPYGIASHLDNPAYGGNGDGYVCARILPDAMRDAFCARGLFGYCVLEQLGLPAYQFVENDNPAQRVIASIPA